MTVQLRGRIDSSNAARMEQELLQQVNGQSEVVLDAAELAYISSAGLRVLLAAQKAMNKQGSMTLTHVNEAVMEILEVTGFTDILTIQ